jgi:hypothetical protein
MRFFFEKVSKRFFISVWEIGIFDSRKEFLNSSNDNVLVPLSSNILNWRARFKIESKPKLIKLFLSLINILLFG